MVWLPVGRQILMIYLFVLTEFTNVTDTHTHTHTHTHRHRMTTYRVGQIKRGQLTFLLVTSERIYKIN